MRGRHSYKMGADIIWQKMTISSPGISVGRTRLIAMRTFCFQQAVQLYRKPSPVLVLLARWRNPT
jgi:hypothetical protein